VEFEEELAVRVDHWEPADAFRTPLPLEQRITSHLDAALGLPRSNDELACVAREVATFFGRYRAHPDEILGQWLAGWCGCTRPPILAWMELEAPPGETLEPLLSEVERQWTDGLRQQGADMRFGVGQGARGSKIVVVIAADVPSLEVHRLGPDAEGVVRLEGRLLDEADVIRAVINRGPTGVAACERDTGVELPAFDLSCRMASEEDQAWIQIVAGTGRMLEGPVGAILARKAAARAYRRPLVRLPARKDPKSALLDGINVLRTQAGLQALVPEPAEARLMQSLYPAAFAADLERDAETTSNFYEELFAGRAVSGPIRFAATFHEIARAGDASDWLAKALLLPTGRQVLLMSRLETIAFVTYRDPAVGFGAAFGAYSLFRESDDTERVELVYSAIERLRNEHGLGATARLEQPPELVLEAGRVRNGELPPEEALRGALATLNARSKRMFTGVWFRVPWNADPDNVPDALLTPPRLECAVVATHRKPPDHAWSEQVVFVVYAISGVPT
jgi:hypothetical protein